MIRNSIRCSILPLVLVVLVLLAPAASAEESEDSACRWTIGYEKYGSSDFMSLQGPVLRRFLGENWEVFLSGGPDDLRTETDWRRWEIGALAAESIDTADREGARADKRESGWVMLGCGRRLIRDDRFWLTAVTGVEFTWSNFQYTSSSTSLLEPYAPYDWILEKTESEQVGHHHQLSVILGVRPAYDLTARITMAVYLGLICTQETGTTDHNEIVRAYDQDGTLIGTRERHERSTVDEDGLNTFGLSGTSNISFFFRF